MYPITRNGRQSQIANKVLQLYRQSERSAGNNSKIYSPNLKRALMRSERIRLVINLTKRLRKIFFQNVRIVSIARGALQTLGSNFKSKLRDVQRQRTV